MPARIALYAGSFDPPTVGHVDLVRRALDLFDHVWVCVGRNPAKQGMFPVEDRLAMFREALGDPGAVSWSVFEGLVVEEARRRGATVLLRGFRGPADLELEGRNALGNRDLSGIETLFLVSDPRWAHVSSSLVREIATLGGDVSRYVPESVGRRLAARR
jgi:pantetheine-phosphate adenylyltransferase